MNTKATPVGALTVGSRVRIGHEWFDVIDSPIVSGEAVTVWLSQVACPGEESQRTFGATDVLDVLIPLSAEQVYWLGKAS